ncbi:undecaprenyl-phosphate glucose phosphotransferase [Flavobacterium sp. Sd200]|nr:undecaprenyl-phosphate glucose phosphotransferase [Flavobacterium sp. Sd200]
MLTILFPLFYNNEFGLNYIHFAAYLFVSWSLIAYFSGFYEIYRYTLPQQIATKIIKQGALFTLVVIAFFPFAKKTIFSGQATSQFLITGFAIITVFKFLLYYYLKKYRISTGSNYRSAIIVGYTPDALALKDFFETKTEYGYRFMGFFSDTVAGDNIKGDVEDIKVFVKQNKVDEIYCSINELTNDQLKDLVNFADAANKTIKFIPDTKEIFSKNLRIDYYEFFPVLSLRKTALHEPASQIIKRGFDIAFSLMVIVFVLSWLAPILALLIKLESKGPVFFKQSRPGLNEKEFFCYKFRSMQINETTEKSVTKNDPRVTRIGKFIRKTSIDELPQFLNVLEGDMSIVGPRPHLWTQNNVYGNTIKKYMVRLYVKPGITGLAQVRGFRGEITNDADMINRIKYDVFYIENWSLLLDFKIIIQTVVNIFMGEEKAY